MKFDFSKKDILKFLICTAGVVLFSLFAYTGFKMLPYAVQYSAPNRTYEQASVLETAEDEGAKQCKYRHFSDIREKGPFTVKSDENEIYVFFENEYLYRVNAKLSEFPEKDKTAISSGITATDFSELCEILSYIES